MSWLKQIQIVKAQILALPAAAQSGSYADLTNKPTSFTPPVATASVLGGVKQGANIAIAADGTISLNYTPPVASTSVSGTVKVDGTTVTITNGVISSAAGYNLPTASGSTLGGVKVGSGLAIDGNGVLSSSGGGAVSSVAGRTGDVTLTHADVGNSGLPYDINGTTFGVPSASQVDVRFYAGRAFALPANLAGSIVKAGTSATAITNILVQKNGATVATITFAAASTTATFSTQAAISFSVGDRFQLVAPATADATLADIDYFLLGSLT